MKLTVLNKNSVLTYIPDKKSVVIRVADVYPMRKLLHSYLFESHYYFSDIDEETEYSIQDDEAIKLSKFILKNIDNVDEIVIHCVYGEGRSPAISYAIATFMDYDDSFYLSKYPNINMYVYKKLLDALIKESL